MKVYEFGEEQLTGLANQIKDELASRLNLPELNMVVVVIGKPSMFGRFANWWDKKDEERLSIVILRGAEPKKRA